MQLRATITRTDRAKKINVVAPVNENQYNPIPTTTDLPPNIAGLLQLRHLNYFEPQESQQAPPTSSIGHEMLPIKKDVISTSWNLQFRFKTQNIFKYVAIPSFFPTPILQENTDFATF
ncbi:hypothetical protein PIB30_087572 [Stylosanthes scabra]|uniref:Uncharacterized protein n=1 Tax=Stylosanthes scabra TaxID=79078 RepID=A0ABU6ZS41_9FABA|nr:hypothetical protein [Stylosanthes scabra]